MADGPTPRSRHVALRTHHIAYRPHTGTQASTRRKTCCGHHKFDPDARRTVSGQSHGRIWPANAARGKEQDKERDDSCAIMEKLDRLNDASGGAPQMIESGALILIGPKSAIPDDGV